MEKSKIRDVFAKYNIPFTRANVWEVQGNPVIYHKALEMMASQAQISFDAPQIIRSERDEAVVMVMGRLPNGVTAWSFGEAVVGVNYRVSGKQAAYVWAMAEKRGKDRVILKLLDLVEAYSEEEADEFKSKPEPEHPPLRAPVTGEPVPTFSLDKDLDKMTVGEKLVLNARRRDTVAKLDEYLRQGPIDSAIAGLGQAEGLWTSQQLQAYRRGLHAREEALAGDATSRTPWTPERWEQQIEKANIALSKAKNVHEVNAWAGMVEEGWPEDIPEDIQARWMGMLQSFRAKLAGA